MEPKANLRAFLLSVGTLAVVILTWLGLCFLAGIDPEHTRLCAFFSVLGGSLLASRVSLRVKHVPVPVPPFLDQAAWGISVIPPGIVFLDHFRLL